MQNEDTGTLDKSNNTGFNHCPAYPIPDYRVGSNSLHRKLHCCPANHFGSDLLAVWMEALQGTTNGSRRNRALYRDAVDGVEYAVDSFSILSIIPPSEVILG